MFNGVESFENHVDGDDERSEDGISSYQGISIQENEATSDLEQSASDAGVNNEAPEIQDADGMSEEAENDNSDATGAFFRLLPYLYLVQRSLGTSPSAMMVDSNEESANCMETGTNQLYESQRLKSLLHLETLKNQFQTSSLRHVFNNLQQCMPLTSVGANDLDDNTNTVDDPSVRNDLLEQSLKYEEPLDLTKKNKRVKVETKTTEEKIMRPNPRGERGYTIQDLEAALHDIKSGKLGTRRAAVIYGIPRSTLRNKVYKMGKCQSKSPQHQEPRIGIQNRMGDKNGNTTKADYQAIASTKIDEKFQVNKEVDANTSLRARKGSKFRSNFPDGSENLLRNDNSSSNEAPSSQIETHSNFRNGSSNLTFSSTGEEGHINRGRRSSSSSLPLHNFSCVQSPGTSYDGMYGDSSAGKKSRPKRGKYRNYDRDALAKAVQAVQNGEMSVHRAGSFFGVPHSTLEYKVKERHLLRQAKFKGNKLATNSANNASQPTAGCSSVTSLSPTAQADSNDSTTFPKVIPDLQLSLSQYLNTNKNFVGSKWSSAAEILGLGFRNAGKDESKIFENFVRSRNPIDESLPNVYDSNTPNDLLDLTKKT